MVELADWQVPRVHHGVSLRPAAKGIAFPAGQASASRHLGWVHERSEGGQDEIYLRASSRVPAALDKRNRPDKIEQLHEIQNEIPDAAGTAGVVREKLVRESGTITRITLAKQLTVFRRTSQTHARSWRE